MKDMLWGGRFSAPPSKSIIEFNSAENVELDRRLVAYDIMGSLAHAAMLAKQGILTAKEHNEIRRALRQVYKEWREGRFMLKEDLEDVHMNIEDAVTRMTPAGKKLHTGRSRNDQILVDMRMKMRDRALEMLGAIESLQEALVEISRRDGPMVSYTHTRVAQPITVSYWCQAWMDSFDRDAMRIREAYGRINVNPLGAGAIAGTSWNIDRKETARLLAFDGVQENELDTITSRGECEAELLAAQSILMCKLSRLATELIWLSQKGLIKLAEEHTTGSSMMPNKKNPDALELVRGRAGRVYGHLQHTLTVLKGLISGYHSDMQETKYAVIDGTRTTLTCLATMAAVIGRIKFDRKTIQDELDRGFAQATEIADYLAKKGVPFREAHERVGRLVKHCDDNGSTIAHVSKSEAERILDADVGDWDSLIGFGRERLKRDVRMQRNGFVKKERERIDKAFNALLG